MSDYASLWSLISASPHYLKAFLGFRNSLLTRTTIRELTARGAILCNPLATPMAVPSNLAPPVAILSVHNIEWLDYKFKEGVEHTLALEINLHDALQTYHSQIESNSSLCLDVQQLKALRALEDVVTWLRFGPELQKCFPEISSPFPHGGPVGGVPKWYVSLRKSTFESYEDINNLDVLRGYHPWIKVRLTESEIQPARMALPWFARKVEISRKQMDMLEAFQRYFPWYNVRTMSQMYHYESRFRKLRPTLSFVLLDSEIARVMRWRRSR